MMKRYSIALFGAVAAILSAQAEVPSGYYDNLEGKSGEDLYSAITELSKGHTRITYGPKTWEAMEVCDVRIIKGQRAWWDMYSNNLVYLPNHDALNREHCVANSWWGGDKATTGDRDAYADLFNLNPSDQNANNKKSNWPPATLADSRILDNGLFRIGTPVEGQGGGAATAFEPSDEYKGDFARAFFYIFTAYAESQWVDSYQYVYGSDKRLQQWAADLLLSWHRLDPVDSKETLRNEAIYGLQNNRNPFIDHPELAEYIWGDKAGTAYAAEAAAEPVDRPEAPAFVGGRLVGINTYVWRWWDGFNLLVAMQETRAESDAKLMVSIDGADFTESDGKIEVPAASGMSDSHVYRAYTVTNVDGRDMRSSIATITMDPIDADETNYSFGKWAHVDDTADIEDGCNYIILTPNTKHVMSSVGGTTGTKFMESAGFVDFDDDDNVTQIPSDAAVVKLSSVDSGKHSLAIYDTRGQFKGYWKVGSGNAMSLDATTYTPGTAEISGDALKFTFDGGSILQFNASQPRFSNYTNTQMNPLLYKFVEFGSITGVQAIETENPWGVGVDGDRIIVDEATTVYDLSGRRVVGNLSHGVYIVVGAGRSQKVIL